MAKQLRTTLKGYFQTGNIPVEQHYIDIIDSTLNISESNSGNIDLIGNISASGNISSSGTSGTHTLGGDLFVTNDITASRNISASGAITGSGINILGNITASGNIKCGELDLGGEFSSVNSDITYMSGSKITLDGAIVATTLDTGQGANELYDMDQNVKTDSTVTFAGITVTKPSLSAGTYGGTISTTGQSFVIQINSIPTIPAKASDKMSKSAPTQITNDVSTTSSVILCTCATANLNVSAFKLATGTFFISIGNEATTDFTSGTATFNFTIF